MIVQIALPASVALTAAFFASVHPIALALAGAAWLVAAFAPALARMLALIAAPVALAAGAQLGIDLRSIALGCLFAFASITPLLLTLRPSLPPARSLAIFGAALALCGAFMIVTPIGRTLAASDLAAGSIAMTLAAGTLASVGAALALDR